MEPGRLVQGRGAGPARGRAVRQGETLGGGEGVRPRGIAADRLGSGQGCIVDAVGGDVGVWDGRVRVRESGRERQSESHREWDGRVRVRESGRERQSESHRESRRVRDIEPQRHRETQRDSSNREECCCHSLSYHVCCLRSEAQDCDGYLDLIPMSTLQDGETYPLLKLAMTVKKLTDSTGHVSVACGSGVPSSCVSCTARA